MSVVIHHGPPGSYKSFCALQRVAIPALSGVDKDFPEGRAVVTNIRGFDSLERIEQALGITLPPKSEILQVNTDTKKGREHCARWFHWAPLGALIILDEVQAIYPAMRRDFKLEQLDYPGGEEQAEADDRPADLPIAFDMHRHYNWDVYLCTTNIGKVHGEIRKASETAYRHWEMGQLLPWKKHCWREIEHDPESTGKSASHAIGVAKEYRADQRIYGCYKSTKTGVAKGAQGSDSIFKDKKLRLVLGVIVVAFCGFIYSAVGVFQRYTSDDEVQPVAVESFSTPAAYVRSNDTGRRGAPSDPSSEHGVTHPLDGVRLEIVGSFSRQYLFHAVIEKDEYSFTQAEIVSMGYAVIDLGKCTAALLYDGHEVQRTFCQFRKIQRQEQPQLLQASFVTKEGARSPER